MFLEGLKNIRDGLKGAVDYVNHGFVSQAQIDQVAKMSTQWDGVDRKTAQGFVTKDSGERQDYPSGMRRDLADGKPDYLLLDQDYLRRWAELMSRGAQKYGADNWRLANSEDELRRFKSSAFRHFMQWVEGAVDEDHAVAVSFNIAAAEYVKEKLK